MTATHLESGPPALVWPGLATARAERAGEPAWALAQRRAAAATAARLPFPDRALELWRRTDFGALPLHHDSELVEQRVQPRHEACGCVSRCDNGMG